MSSHNPRDPSKQAGAQRGDHTEHPNNAASEKMNEDIILWPENFDEQSYDDSSNFTEVEYDPRFTGNLQEAGGMWLAEENGASPSNSSTSHQGATSPAGDTSAGEGPSTPRPTRYRFYDDKPSADKWEAAKPLLEELYMKRGMTLQDVARVMERDYKFIATERSYKYRFSKKWNWYKNKPKEGKERK